MKSFKPEVMVKGETEWCGNALRFVTQKEAEENARDLMSRWMLVTDTRVVPSEDEPADTWVNGQLGKIGKPETLHTPARRVTL